MTGFRAFVCGACFVVAIASAAQADLKKCMIFNSTVSPIAAVQVRATGQSRWQENLLSQHTIGVSRSWAVQITTPPCLYDFFVTFDDGHRRIIPHVNVCAKQASLSVTGS